MVGLGSAVVAAALAAGCASQAVGPRAREWLELRSGHFILATDLDRHRAEAVASGLEESWSALAHVYQVIVPGRPPPDHELRIVHLNDCADVHALRPGTGGFVELSADFLSDPTAVTCGAFVGRSRTSVLHEVAHVFNLHYLHAHPSWLNEGLATYFQSVAVEGGRILLGRVADSAADLWRMAVPVPALGVLWQGMPGPGVTRAFWYFGALNLVHLLNGGSDDYHRRFQMFLGLGAGGTPWVDAWNRAFGDLPDGRLEQEYIDYHLRKDLRLYAVAFRAPPPRPLRVHRLGAAEAHAVRASLFIMTGQFTAARQELAEAERDDPGWVEAPFWRAVFYTWFPYEAVADDKDPLALLRTYVDHVPGDARARAGIVTLGLRRYLPGDDFELDGSVPAGLAGMIDDVEALARVADSASALNNVAWYYAVSQRPDIGLRFSERALALNPSCAACLDTLALLYHELGRHAEALDAQERAVLLFGEYDPGRGVRERLDRYRELAGGAR